MNTPSLAFVFPGQGSQAPGMGQFLYDEFQIARNIFEQASETLEFDIKQLCFTGTIEELSKTENTQPALLTVSVATALVLREIKGLTPTLTAGHSIGEYASLVLGDALDFTTALKAVRLRGQAMQSAVPLGQGGMIATLGLNEEQVEFLCRWASENSGHGPLSPANFNCEGQIVISGSQKALDYLKEHFKPEILPGEAKRVKLIPLQVSAPFHCEMMKPAQEKMAQFFAQNPMRNSKLPIIQNIHAKAETESSALQKNLIAQVSGSVRWTQTMRELKNRDCTNIIECGHGSVLKGLFKKADSEFFKVYSTANQEDLKNLETLLI